MLKDVYRMNEKSHPYWLITVSLDSGLGEERADCVVPRVELDKVTRQPQSVDVMGGAAGGSAVERP